MEITITLEKCLSNAPLEGQERIGPLQPDSPEPVLTDHNPILKAKFVMVAIDRSTQKSTRVSPLRLESDQERALFLAGAEHKTRKQVEQQISLENSPPSVEEMILIHALYREYIQYLDPSYKVEKPDNVVWMKDTIRQSLVLCMPQVRV